VRADGEEHRIEAAALHRLQHVRDFRAELQLDAELEDAADLRVEHLARQAVLGDAEAHHPARDRARLPDGHRVAEARELIGGRKARGPGADDQHALAGRGGRPGELPARAQRLVAEEALDRIDADAFVELRAVARGLAGVIADPAHHGGQRVVLCQHAPGLLVVPGFGMEQPALDVLTGGTGMVAGRQPVHVHGADRPPGAGPVGEARARIERDGEGLGLHPRRSTSSCSR
jgi:hypothetical protein